VSYLSIKDLVAVDLVLSDESTSIFTEIVEHFDNVLIFKYLLKVLREPIKFCHVE